MDLFASLNWIAIVVSAIVFALIGPIWFSRALFLKRWEKGAGLRMKIGLFNTIGQAIISFLIAVGVSVISEMMKIPGLKGGILLGLLLIVCFVIPLNSCTWLFKKKPLLFIIDAGYHSFSILVISIILNLWR